MEIVQTMEETPAPNGPMPATKMRKACQISIMFPVEDDTDALHVKTRIDAIVEDIKDKRYNFSISEV